MRNKKCEWEWLFETVSRLESWAIDDFKKIDLLERRLDCLTELMRNEDGDEHSMDDNESLEQVGLEENPEDD